MKFRAKHWYLVAGLVAVAVVGSVGGVSLQRPSDATPDVHLEEVRSGKVQSGLQITAPSNGTSIPLQGTTNVTWSGGDPTTPKHITLVLGDTDWRTWDGPAGDPSSFSVANSDLYRSTYEEARLCVWQGWGIDSGVRSCADVTLVKESPYNGVPKAPRPQIDLVVPEHYVSVFTPTYPEGTTRFEWTTNRSDLTTKMKLYEPGDNPVDKPPYYTTVLAAGVTSYDLPNRLLRPVQDSATWVCFESTSLIDASWVGSDCTLVYAGPNPVAGYEQEAAELEATFVELWAGDLAGDLEDEQLSVTGAVKIVAQAQRSTSAQRVPVRVKVQFKQGKRWITIGDKRMKVVVGKRTKYKVSRTWKKKLGKRVTAKVTVWYGGKAKTRVLVMRVR